MAQAPLFRLSLDLCFGHQYTPEKRIARMAWEDDVLSSYEQDRIKTATANTLSSQRLKLLEDNHQHAWFEVRAAVSKTITDLNGKAGREILKSSDPYANRLAIDREDGEKLKASYDPKTRVATFESDAVPFFTRTYELAVRVIDGNDKVVWMVLPKKDIESPEHIARIVITEFMKAGHLHL